MKRVDKIFTASCDHIHISCVQHMPHHRGLIIICSRSCFHMPDNAVMLLSVLYMFLRLFSRLLSGHV